MQSIWLGVNGDSWMAHITYTRLPYPPICASFLCIISIHRSHQVLKKRIISFHPPYAQLLDAYLTITQPSFFPFAKRCRTTLWCAAGRWCVWPPMRWRVCASCGATRGSTWAGMRHAPLATHTSAGGSLCVLCRRQMADPRAGGVRGLRAHAEAEHLVLEVSLNLFCAHQ